MLCTSSGVLFASYESLVTSMRGHLEADYFVRCTILGDNDGSRTHSSTPIVVLLVVETLHRFRHA